MNKKLAHSWSKAQITNNSKVIFRKKDSNCLVTSTKPKKLITRITQNAVFAEIVVKC